MRKDCGFGLVDEWEPHDGIVGECEIHHRESYGHCSASVFFPYSYEEYDGAQWNDLISPKPDQRFIEGL